MPGAKPTKIYSNLLLKEELPLKHFLNPKKQRTPVNKQYQSIFLGELERQGSFAFRAINDVNQAYQKLDTDSMWYSLQAFLIAFANISKIFWPSKDRPPYKERGEFMRNLLKIDETSEFYTRDPRNHFEHFDERIDDWWQMSKDHNFVDANIGPTGAFGDLEHLRFFDTTKLSFVYRGKEYPITPMIDAVIELKKKIEELSQQTT